MKRIFEVKYGDERKIKATHGIYDGQIRESFIFGVLRRLINNRFLSEDELVLGTGGASQNMAFRDIMKRGYIARVKAAYQNQLLYQYYITPRGKLLYKKLVKRYKKEQDKLTKELQQTNKEINNEIVVLNKAQDLYEENSGGSDNGIKGIDMSSRLMRDITSATNQIEHSQDKLKDLTRLKRLLQELLGEINYILGGN